MHVAVKLGYWLSQVDLYNRCKTVVNNNTCMTYAYEVPLSKNMNSVHGSCYNWKFVGHSFACRDVYWRMKRWLLCESDGVLLVALVWLPVPLHRWTVCCVA